MKRILTLLGLVLIFLLTTAISGSAENLLSNYIASKVADIHSSGWSRPYGQTEFNGKLYFVATDEVYGRELWVYSGAGSPNIVADINTGIGDSFPTYDIWLKVYNNQLYFTATDGTNGLELWSYDGLNPPTMVADINSGSESSSPGEYALFYRKLFFNADDGSNGRELWVYDGVKPPSMVANIHHSGDSNPGQFAVYGGKLFFQADNGSTGQELWVYDGDNPPLLKADINPSGDSNPSYLTVFNNKLYFSADNGSTGQELWVYDGVNFPSIVADINSGVSSSSPESLIVYLGKLYFGANNGTLGNELMALGTSGSPYLVADIAPGIPGSLNSNYTTFAILNERLFFLADNGTNGDELWMFDNSNPPSMAVEILTGAQGAEPYPISPFNGKLYFAAIDDSNDDELWVYEPIIQQEMFYSQALYDGWVRESGENTNIGGLINATNLICNIGDDPLNRQFRSFLHFNTSRLPDTAVVTKSTLQYKQHSIIGVNPYATHGKVWADIKEGFFSNNPGLVQSDFAALPSKGFAGWFKLYPSSLTYPIYRARLKDSSFQYLNLTGITQFRLRFAIDDDNDNTADYIKVFCGDMGVPFNRPVLRVWYYVP
jgi:ELWxxDGT repeat protein